MESRLDQVYRSVLLTKFFTKGWGTPSTLEKIIRLRKELGNREKAQRYGIPETKIILTKEEKQDNCTLINGEFKSPLAELVPGVLPPESVTAHFQAVLPHTWSGRWKPLVVHFAGTGDHFFWRRRTLMAKPMIKERNIGSIILENPYYGLRKPATQFRSSLHYVSDLFVMGAALILEAQLLMNWATRQGFGPLISHGISMGGHMAALAATSWTKPICLVPCLASTSASVTFCQGVMTRAINWKQLHEQYENNPDYKNKIWELLNSPEFSKETGASDQFIKDSFLSPQSNISLKYFRKLSTENRTSIEAFMFMRGLMDECTHLENFSSPLDPELIEIVAAKYDAYQPQGRVKPLEDLWRGSNIRFVEEGHVSSYLFHQNVFREAIYDSFNKYSLKYN
ncbi:protein ABHD18 [Eurytemora carolleeae]|uniref:protein ABHD18 n=1 Tax=Eurytemora carolleeae TaxID=1294199 RepID=UPI000C778860|nr:protein ABHD18 [Eurytemora carolleeae]|eukprot:XP_023321753.1 protein ABHD18-like [Eurytemora affinis]